MSINTPTTTSYPGSWVDVYRIFMGISDHVLDTTPNHDEAHKIIAERVNSLYAQHEGHPAWDIAYERWIEPADDDEEEE